MGKEDFAIARERSHHAPHRRKRYGQSKVPGATLRYIQGISTKLLAKHDLWTIEYRPVQVTMCVENRRSVVLTLRAYRRKYRGKRAPSDSTIRRLVPNFLEFGTVGDRHYEFAGIYTWDTGCKQEGQIAGFVRPDTDWIQTTLRKPIKELKRIEREYLRSH
ncbi:unnamed protein product [Acanthoscelides obtectus]|uniref:DUF4817 domain-containing protein n=1 Tax=Acanthoscelides obtectus TaxID=200917 RepID=A0A9P0VSD5_ACAOB|nr:unnamed protein product [Acanthoscelides obtectus]CAK1659900.1 hypothetical protein AOBTE_LOCUS21739 [Acanthoscelides obtectus]